VADKVRELAAQYPDAEIATKLNTQGLKAGKSAPFTARKVRWIRYVYRIRSGCPQAPGACPGGQRGDGRYSAKAAAELLNVDRLPHRGLVCLRPSQRHPDGTAPATLDYPDARTDRHITPTAPATETPPPT
jgi:hypothetical protein